MSNNTLKSILNVNGSQYKDLRCDMLKLSGSSYNPDSSGLYISADIKENPLVRSQVIPR